MISILSIFFATQLSKHWENSWKSNSKWSQRLSSTSNVSMFEILWKASTLCSCAPHAFCWHPKWKSLASFPTVDSSTHTRIWSRTNFPTPIRKSFPIASITYSSVSSIYSNWWTVVWSFTIRIDRWFSTCRTLKSWKTLKIFTMGTAAASRRTKTSFWTLPGRIHVFLLLANWPLKLNSIFDDELFFQSTKNRTVANDTYRTDIPLLYPPHLIAIGAFSVNKIDL